MAEGELPAGRWSLREIADLIDAGELPDALSALPQIVGLIVDVSRASYLEGNKAGVESGERLGYSKGAQAMLDRFTAFGAEALDELRASVRKEVQPDGEVASGQGASAVDLTASISELGLRTGVFTALTKDVYLTIGDLTRATRQQLLDVYDIGPKAVDEIVKALHSRGLGLSEPQGAP